MPAGAVGHTRPAVRLPGWIYATRRDRRRRTSTASFHRFCFA
jgi:hypothetical protein